MCHRREIPVGRGLVSEATRSRRFQLSRRQPQLLDGGNFVRGWWEGAGMGVCQQSHLSLDWGEELKTRHFFLIIVLQRMGKIKLKLTTLPRIFIHVVCQFSSIALAICASCPYRRSPLLLFYRMSTRTSHPSKKHSYRTTKVPSIWCLHL